jgi:type IV pilus assembly protein PilC
MLATISDYFPSLQDLIVFVLLMLFYAVAALVPVCCFLYGIYLLLTRPMRRNERVRLFVDILELGLKDGRSPEAAIVDAASSRDPELGRHFQKLAALLNKGMRFSEALDKSPRLIPAQIAAMLKAGERIGDLAKVLPACRRLLDDAVSQVRGALNYLVLVAFAVTPFTLFVPVMLNIFVLPKFREVFQGMTEGTQLPAFTEFVFAHSALVTCIQAAVLSVIWLAAVAYIGGPRLTGWVGRILPGVPDRIAFQMPWRRKRLQRDFSAMLAVLLDAGVTETEAVRLAAGSTANAVMRQRAEKVCMRLAGGVDLPEAIRALDDSGELRWRLANALRRGRDFLHALAGWNEALDARAFQSEQSIAQVATTALVLLNGLVVAGVVIAVFLVLINMVNNATLW